MTHIKSYPPVLISRTVSVIKLIFCTIYSLPIPPITTLFNQSDHLGKIPKPCNFFFMPRIIQWRFQIKRQIF